MNLTYMLVSLAAMLYITNWIKEAINEQMVASSKRRFIELKKLHTRTAEAIEVPFNLWWEGEARSIVSKRIVSSFTDQIPNDAPEEVKEMLAHLLPIGPMVDDIRDTALELAIHTYSADEENALVQQLPRYGGIRRHVGRDIEQRQENIESSKTSLIAVGLDPDEIAKRFTKTTGA